MKPRDIPFSAGELLLLQWIQSYLACRMLEDMAKACPHVFRDGEVARQIRRLKKDMAAITRKHRAAGKGKRK